MPTLQSLAAELYRDLLPLAYAEQRLDYPMAKYVGGIGLMLQDINDLVRDTDLGPGWSALVDADRTPADALDWLAQMAGTTLDPSLSTTARRGQIRTSAARERGTVAALAAAAQPYLTGSKAVVVTERDGGAYRISVSTQTSQTPDPVKVLDALLQAKAAGLILNYTNISGQTYQHLKDTNATYQTVFTKYGTYKGALFDQAGV